MMTLQQREEIFLNEYEMFGFSLQDTFKFINLVGVLYTKAIEKDPELTVYQLLNKLVNAEENGYVMLYERAHFHVKSHVYMKSNFSTLGLKSAKEIVEEIKRLLTDWLPF